MPLKDYLEFVEPLRLPCAGKEYALPTVGVKSGVLLVQALDQASEVTVSDEDLARILLGSALEEMQADDVPPGFIAKATLTALADFRGGRDAAVEVWDTLDPKALLSPPNRPTVGVPGSPPSTRTGAARRTRSRASTTTTKTSRPNSKPSAKAAGSRSAGSKSSSSGPSSKAASTPSSASTS